MPPPKGMFVPGSTARGLPWAAFQDSVSPMMEKTACDGEGRGARGWWGGCGGRGRR